MRRLWYPPFLVVPSNTLSLEPTVTSKDRSSKPFRTKLGVLLGVTVVGKGGNVLAEPQPQELAAADDLMMRRCPVGFLFVHGGSGGTWQVEAVGVGGGTMVVDGLPGEDDTCLLDDRRLEY